MSEYHSYWTYVESEGYQLFTIVCLPNKTGKFPTVLYRTPYANADEHMDEQKLVEDFENNHKTGLAAGYAFIYQHCRGRGKSTGDFLPYIHEREDTKALYAWVRQQDFYDGNLFINGGSYTSSVHFTAAPFDEDIKGAVLCIQDCERYNIKYRNGILRAGMHGKWFVENYKRKSRTNFDFDEKLFFTLPFTDFMKKAVGEEVEYMTEDLMHPDRNDPFWQTRHGGGEAHDAIKNTQVPILLVTGFFDIYTGGVFDMWNGMDEETKKNCALLVHPNCHRIYGADYPDLFTDSDPREHFGGLELQWFESVMKGTPTPCEKGKVSYYTLFENAWHTDDFATPEKMLTFKIGEGEKTYLYDPADPAYFSGGLSTCWGGATYQDPPNSKQDILSFYTPDFAEDTVIGGRMKAKLRVKSDCEDTAFYMRISLKTEKGDFGLRDDITKLSNLHPDYKPGDEVEVEFDFDELSIMIKKGEALRIDISSSCLPTFLPHTNYKGLYSVQTERKTANNTVVLDKSSLTVFVE